MRVSDLKQKSWLSVLSIPLVTILQLGCSPQQTSAQQGRETLEEVAQAMGGLDALRAIENITRQGTAQTSSLRHGRLSTESAWVQPARPFNQTIDFTVPREITFRISGGVVSMADGVKGGYRDIAGRTLTTLDASQLGEYRTEWNRDIARFLVHALGEESEIEAISESILEGQPQQVVHVRYIDGILYKVSVQDSSHLISKLEFTEAHPRYGDLDRERIFSDYQEVGNLKLPFSVVYKDMGEVAQVREWSEISVNDELQENLFEIPEAIRESVQSLAQIEAIQMTPTELAPGVYFGETKGMNSMWVEFEDFVTVVEGPNNEKQSLETLRQIRETIGEKPIRYLVTTHHHEDHNGGIRTYAAQGTTIITHVKSEPAIREHLAYPFTLAPDRFSQSQQEPKIELITDGKTISDGTRNLEVVYVPTPHADSNLLIYLPRERLVFQSDMFSILRGETGTPRAPAQAKALYDAVTQAGWRVDQIVPGHGRLSKWSELVAGLEASK